MLDLSSNYSLKENIPLALRNHSSLEILCLDDLALSGNIPPHLGNLKDLTKLSIVPLGCFGDCPPYFRFYSSRNRKL